MDTPARKFLEDTTGLINHCITRDLPKPINPQTDPLLLMQIDADYTCISLNQPVIRLFGITESANSVMLLVHNFEPYFYVPLPSNFPFGPDEKQQLTEMLLVNFEIKQFFRQESMVVLKK